MPLISTKGIYGLNAMAELSKNHKDMPMQVKDISKNAKIPKNYLEQLLSKLRKANLVQSIRGAKGGYILAKSPKEIRILDILVALEGDIKVVDAKVDSLGLGLFFDDIKNSMKTFLDKPLTVLNDYDTLSNEFLNYNI